MLGRSHIIFGAGTYLVAGEILLNQLEISSVHTSSEWLYFLPIAILGALVPDIDHHNSTIKQNFLIRILTIPFRMLGHRTWSHSLLILALMGLVLTTYLDGKLWLIGFAFWVGYASHVLGDWMTPAGVQLLYPLNYRFSSPISFRTGSFFEYYVALLPLGGYLVIGLLSFIK